MSMAKGVVSDQSEFSAAAARYLVLKGSDLVILIGARLNWMLSHGEAPTFNPNAKFIQLDIEATEFDSNQKISAPLLGDLGSILNKLVPVVKHSGYQAPKEWTDSIAAKIEENSAKMCKLLEDGINNAKFGFYAALSPIKKYFSNNPDTYLISEGPNTLDIGRNMIDMQLPRHRLDTGTWGVMGIGLGYAIATAIETGKPVVALEGDSAFGFDGMEMETICRYRMPITVVVINNGGIYNGTDRQVADQPGPTMLDAQAHYELISKAFGEIVIL